MQESDCEKKNALTVLLGNSIERRVVPSAIGCMHKDEIIILDPFKYTVLNYRTNKVIEEKQSMLRATENICFHHHKNMVFYFDENGGFTFNFDTNSGKSFYNPVYSISDGSFSKKDPLLFLVDRKKLIFYNYDTESEKFIRLKRKINLLFACPSEDNPYFVYCHASKKNNSICTLIEDGKNYKEKKLCVLPKGFMFDQTNWAYSHTKSLLCLINQKNRMLHVFNIKNAQSKQYSCGDGFPIETMMFHPNKIILTLLSHNKDCIQYVDMSSFEKMRHVFTSNHESLSDDEWDKQSIKTTTFSHKGDHLFICIGCNIFNIQVPFFISNPCSLERWLLAQRLPVLHDIHRIIGLYLYRIYRKNRGN